MTIAPPDPILGDPRLMPRILEGEVKAAGFEGRARFLERTLGRAGLERFARGLSPSAREALLRPPIASAWLPFAPMLELERAMISEVLGGDPARLGAVIAEMARADVPTLYRFVLKVGGPSLVLKRISVTYSSRVRPGTLVAEQLSDSEALGRLEGGVIPYYTCRYVVPAWASVALELAGARDVTIEQTSCAHLGGEHCRWSVRWR